MELDEPAPAIEASKAWPPTDTGAAWIHWLEYADARGCELLCRLVLVFRYFEFGGEIRQALSVVKKRSGPHEHAIRELKLYAGGVLVGRSLKEFSGVLTGVPNFKWKPGQRGDCLC